MVFALRSDTMPAFCEIAQKYALDFKFARYHAHALHIHRSSFLTLLELCEYCFLVWAVYIYKLYDYPS